MKVSAATTTFLWALLTILALRSSDEINNQLPWVDSQQRLEELLQPGNPDPKSSFDKYVYGVYRDIETAEQKITSEFLSKLETKSIEFIDATRILLATEPPSHLNQTEFLSPLGRLILSEITARGDNVTPVLLEFMDKEKDNPYCGIQSRIFGLVGAVKTIDPLPYLEYARQYVRDHPNEKMTRENSSNYSGINQILSLLGKEDDIALLESREGGGNWLVYLKPRLAKEKETGTTRLEERRRESNEHRAKYGLPIIQLTAAVSSESSGRKIPNPGTKELHQDDTGTYTLLLALSLVLIGGGITIMTARRMR